MRAIMSEVSAQLKPMAVLLVMVIMGGVGGSAFRVDPFYGSQGEALAARIALVEARQENMKKALAKQQKWIDEAPPDLYEESVRREFDHLERQIEEMRTDSRREISALRTMVQNLLAEIRLHLPSKTSSHRLFYSPNDWLSADTLIQGKP